MQNYLNIEYTRNQKKTRQSDPIKKKPFFGTLVRKKKVFLWSLRSLSEKKALFELIVLCTKKSTPELCFASRQRLEKNAAFSQLYRFTNLINGKYSRGSYLVKQSFSFCITFFYSTKYGFF
jgi:hypothetical protein